MRLVRATSDRALGTGREPQGTEAIYRRIGADMVVLTDTQGKVLASSAPEEQGQSLQRWLTEATEQRDQPVFRVLGDHVYQFFLAPVRTPETIAWVAMGFVVNDAFAQKLRALIGADVTLVAHGDAGLSRIASSLANQHIPGSDYLSFTQRIEGRGDPVDVIVQKSMHEVLAPYRDVRDSMLFIDTDSNSN